MTLLATKSPTKAEPLMLRVAYRFHPGPKPQLPPKSLPKIACSGHQILQDTTIPGVWALAFTHAAT